MSTAAEVEIVKTAEEQGVPFVQTTASVLLDLLRGVAALVVLLNHWRNACYLDYQQLPSSRRLLAVPYLLTSAGHQAVVVFFVLSGYLIGGTIFRALGRGRWSWREYLLHRGVRLWVVLLPGLVLCELWDRLGIWLGRAPLLYGGANYNHMTSAVLPSLGAGTFLENLLFLGGLRVPTLGSDSALWSLGFEFWYYLLFPALLLLLLERRWKVRLLLFAVAVAAGWAGGPGVIGSFPVWLMGACLAAVPSLPRLPPKARWLYLVLYVALFFGLSKQRWLPGLVSDYLTGVLTVVLLIVLLSWRKRASKQGLFVRISRGLARISFTLYVTHLPFLFLLFSLVAGDRRWPVNGRTTVVGAGVLAAVLAYAWLVAAATEFRTDTVRRWIEGKWLSRSTGAI